MVLRVRSVIFLASLCIMLDFVKQCVGVTDDSESDDDKPLQDALLLIKIIRTGTALNESTMAKLLSSTYDSDSVPLSAPSLPEPPLDVLSFNNIFIPVQSTFRPIQNEMPPVQKFERRNMLKVSENFRRKMSNLNLDKENKRQMFNKPVINDAKRRINTKNRRAFYKRQDYDDPFGPHPNQTSTVAPSTTVRTSTSPSEPPNTTKSTTSQHPPPTKDANATSTTGTATAARMTDTATAATTTGTATPESTTDTATAATTTGTATPESTTDTATAATTTGTATPESTTDTATAATTTASATPESTTGTATSESTTDHATAASTTDTATAATPSQNLDTNIDITAPSDVQTQRPKKHKLSFLKATADENVNVVKSKDPVISQVQSELENELKEVASSDNKKGAATTLFKFTRLDREAENMIKTKIPSTLRIHLLTSSRYPLPLPENHAFCFTNPESRLCRTPI